MPTDTATMPRKPRTQRGLALQPRFCRMQAVNLETRAAAAGSAISDLVEVTGQVIVYDTPYQVNDMWGEFTETIHFGSAAPVLAADPDVRFLYGHNSQSLFPLARSGAVTSVTLEDSPAGLNIRAQIDTRLSAAQDLIVSLENGTITQMSVGMEVDPMGDVWSGEDDWGMPNVRDIFRLANIFDVSAVTYPASPTTTIELSNRMADLAPEVTLRTQRLWNLAKEGRQGTLSQADSDALLHLIDRLHAAGGESPRGEGRNAPTDQDGIIADKIAAAHSAVADALAAQTKDPDNNTDPVDKKVWNSLTAAQGALTEALQAQGKDGAPDAEKPEEKSAEGDGEYQGDPDGTLTGGGGNAPIPDNEDGTGSRSAEPKPDIDRLLQIDQDLLRLSRPPVYA